MLRRSRDLFAVHVAEGDVGDYNVTEAGWYAVDDGERIVLGPFTSLAAIVSIRHPRRRCAGRPSLS